MKANHLTHKLAAIACAGLTLTFIACQSTTDAPSTLDMPQVGTSHDHSSRSQGSNPNPIVETPAPKADIKPYPLAVCLVSDEELDSMGGPITEVYQGQEVKFCCKGCVKDFNASPATFLAKLN